MSKFYTASGITAATAATADHVIAALWNPASNRRLTVVGARCSKSAVGAADIPRLARITTQGTVGSTITPTIVNHHERDLAPPSGALLNLAAFSVQPTIEPLRLHSFYVPASIGAGLMWAFEGEIEIPAGNGLAFVTGSALAYPVSSADFTWHE